MSSQEQIVTSADGTAIWAEATGDPTKPPLVLIHGLACSALAFDSQFLNPVMARDLYMVRYEMRGHGRSGVPEQVEAYGSMQQAEDFRAVCSAFGLRRPVVLGWSLGGSIIADIASYLGIDYISGVVYSGGSVISKRLLPFTLPPAFLSLMPSVTSNDATEAARFSATFVESCVANPAIALPWRTKLLWMGAFATQPPYARSHSINGDQDDTALVAEGKEWPVLLIQGDQDTHCVSGVIISQAKEIFVDLDVHLLEGVGHSPHFERPAVVNQLIRSFVQRIYRFN